MVTTRLTAMGLVLAIALAACGGDEPSLTDPTTIPGSGDCPTEGVENPNPRPSSTAKVTIQSPSNGDVIQGDSVIVKVKITGACILAEAQRAVREDTGHVHIAMDGTTITLLAGTEYELTDVSPGLHKIEVEFAAADHQPFSPPVLKTVTFRVAP